MPVNQRGSSWQAVVHHKGKRYRKDFPTRHEAEAYELAVKSAILSGDDPVQSAVPKAMLTLADMFKLACLRYWRNAKAAPNLIRNGQAVVDFFGDDMPMSRIDKAKIDSFIDHLKEKGNSNATINRKLAALSKMLTIALHEGAILKRPHMERKKESEGRLEWWTVDMEKNALAWCEQMGRHDLADFIQVSIDTGMRISETLRVRKRDIDWDQGNGLLFVWESKSGKSRSIPLTRRAAAIYKRRLDAEDRAFIMTKWTVTHWWRQMIEHIGAEGMGTPHTLRHTFCSRLVQRGIPLKEVQELAGHSSLSVTMRYAKLAPKNLARAIAALEQPED